MRRARLALAMITALGARPSMAQAPAGAELPYRVDCAPTTSCRVDLATYVGWRAFQAQCATCHAADAEGSSFAPDLTERLRRMDKHEFFAALDRGYLGPTSTSKPRGRDPNVAPYYEELWAYLLARTKGDLPGGPVEILRDDDAGSP